MSDANRVALRFNEEAVFGVSPSATLSLLSLNITQATKKYEPSGQITGDTLTVTAPSTINDSGDGFVAAGFVAGQKIIVSGFTNAANNGVFTIAGGGVAIGALTLVEATLVTETPGNANVRISTAVFTTIVLGQTILIAGCTNSDSNGYKNVASVAWNVLTVEEAIGANETSTANAVSMTTAYNELRYTGESFRQETDTAESNEIRDDRQVPFVARTNLRGLGDLNLELSYSAYDRFLAASLMSAGWSDIVTLASQTDISFIASDNSVNDASDGFVSAGFLQYQWIKISGTLNGANDGIYKIATVAVGKMVLQGGTVVDETAGESITITMGAQIVNGVAQRSFTVEREYSDLSNEFARFAGSMIDTVNIDITAEQIITGSFSFIGKNAASATATLSAATPKAAPTKDVMTAVDDILALLENNTDQEANTLTFQVQNKLRQRTNIGVLGAVSVGSGKIGVTGTIQMYFESKAIMDKYLAYTTSRLAVMTEDADGNSYVVEFPRMKYTSGQAPAGSTDSDVIGDMAFAAYWHPDEDVTVRIARFAA